MTQCGRTLLIALTGPKGVLEKKREMMKILGFMPFGIMGFLFKGRIHGVQRYASRHARVEGKRVLVPNVVPWLRMVINKGVM